MTASRTTADHALPIDALLPALRDSLAAHPRLVLEAPPGAGKTTRVPLALLDAPWLRGRRIVMLEPRRVAARAAAQFMAQQLGEPVGETVGYRIRSESKVSARTRIEVVTEGILTRLLQDDPMLGAGDEDGDGTHAAPRAVGALLFDEFHERHLAADLGLALALDVQTALREDLRIVVMSATLDGERLASHLDAPRLTSAGRAYPVDIRHLPAQRDESLESHTVRAVTHALTAHPGDVLVFLPGQREILRVQAALEARRSRIAGAGASAAASVASATMAAGTALPGTAPEVSVLVLHGELSVEQQSAVLRPDPQGHRRVVLATNVAESSVTLPGVRVVVDAGLAREPRFDPNSGFSRLDVVRIAQASADQRAGRAGRVAEGWAYRLWPESQRLEAQRRAEIGQTELSGLALELAAWGSDALRFVDAPPSGALAAARDLLQRIGALDADQRISALGRRMLTLGTHPRLAAMLMAASGARTLALACDLAALIEARDPLRPAAGASRSDGLIDRWRALVALRRGQAPREASRSALAAIDAAAMQWRRRLGLTRAAGELTANDVPAHALGDLLAHAFPDRIAARHPSDLRRYQLANGRMARLFDDSTLIGEPWLVLPELRFDAKDALVLRGVPVDEAYLRRAFTAGWSDRDETRWDDARGALVAERVQRFEAIVLDVRPGSRVDAAAAAAALTRAVRERGLEALPWTPTLRQWRLRVQCLRAWLPSLADAHGDAALPDLGDDALLASLDAWLRPALDGLTRLDALDSDAFAHALMALLPWPLRQRVEALAPTRIAVPSGMERAIAYAAAADGTPEAPVLAVKLQELFGLADTPRIVDGRVPLTLHLLSPAGRPLQVTQDLRGFWERTYPDVKREMKGRYPKHPWPDDPWSAVATHRAKPRGT